MKICFQRDAWDESAVTHAYTYRFPYTNRFVQRDTCIQNGENPAMPDGFDYLSIMTREKYPLGTTITTRCSFSGDAASLLIFADALDACEDGVFRYGNYFEVVLYKNGINVWRLWRREDGEVTWHKRLGVKFPVREQETHTLCVTPSENEILIVLDEMRITLRVEDFFPAFHLGLTGCEGPCSFYDMTVE